MATKAKPKASGRKTTKPVSGAGYSGTPLPQKLGIKDGHEVAVLGSPAGFDRTLGALPTGVKRTAKIGKAGKYDVLVAFVTRRSELERHVETLRPHMQPAAGLWIAWPKKSSGVATDVTEDVVRAVALPIGLVDNKVCAIDETWSGLRLVIRRENR